MRRSRILGGVLLLTVVAVTAGHAAGAAFLVIDDVTVEPHQPMPGELATIEVTVDNPSTNPANVELTDIAIRDRGRSQEHVRVENIAVIQPGSSTTAILKMSFEEKGRKLLSVHVWGIDRGTGTRIHIKRPLTVTVGAQHPAVDVDTEETIVGTDATGSVTLANGFEDRIRNVKLSVKGTDDVTVTDGESVVPVLDAGATTSTNFTYRAHEPGRHNLTTVVRYTTSGGTQRRLTRNATIVADPLQDDVVLDVHAVGSGPNRAVSVSVINRGNVPAERVSVVGSSPNASVRQAIIDAVPPGESRTVRLNLTLERPVAEVTVDATYDLATIEGSASTSTTIHTSPGSIRLTGVRVTAEGDGLLHVTGSASNVGLTDAQSVRIAVMDTESVDPAYPTKEYFVGTVPSSDFVSFDVYARTTTNASQIPLRIAYIVDGETRQRTVTVEAPTIPDVDRTAASSGGTPDLLIPAAIGGLALLVVVGVVLRYWLGGSNDEL